jgi:hypothetical protein
MGSESMIIYLIIHLHHLEGITLDSKLIGLFTGYQIVQRVIAECIKTPGFSEQPDNFVIRRIEVPDIGVHSMVYLVSYYVHDQDYDVEYDGLIGVFSGFEEASKAKLSFETDNLGYILNSQLVTKVTIDKYELNIPNWSEGYNSDSTETTE